MSSQKSSLKGAIYVGLGASFYGMLATFVKIAYNQGYTTAEVTTAQFLIGLLGLFTISRIVSAKNNKKQKIHTSKKDVKKLIFAGFSYGTTSLFYYLSVQHIDVSIAIVLLMQSVWFSVVVEAFLNKKFPETRKIIATIIVLAGTLLATNAINQSIELNLKGVIWGLLAAVSYTVTMFTANQIANHLPSSKKSLYMLLGGTVIILTFLFFTQIGPYYFETIHELTGPEREIQSFDFSIFYTYGLFLAVFGTILPPILLNKGFPHAGLGLGSIVSSLELPVSVSMALLLLHENVVFIQWIGIVLILLAIILMNVKRPNKSTNNTQNSAR